METDPQWCIDLVSVLMFEVVIPIIKPLTIAHWLVTYTLLEIALRGSLSTAQKSINSHFLSQSPCAKIPSPPRVLRRKTMPLSKLAKNRVTP